MQESLCAHIVYASDDKFAEILGISIVSLLANSRDMEEIVVYILDSGISEKNRKKIECIFEEYSRQQPVWIAAKDISEELCMDVAVDRGSLSQYARLFISRDLPKGLDRVLYLDCDTIINQSILELWNLDMHGKTIATLMDAFSKYYRANIDLQPNDIMFNSGVMLIDLKQWAEKKIEKKLLEFIANRNGKIQQGDQGALNAILSHDTYCFEARFNSVTIFFDFSYEEMLTYRKPPFFYAEDEIVQAIENPTIIHFTTSFLSRRPWVEGCQHRYLSKWLAYKAMSPWAEMPLWKYDKGKGVARIYKAIVPKIPRFLMIGISGVLQGYGRPLLNRIRNK